MSNIHDYYSYKALDKPRMVRVTVGQPGLGAGKMGWVVSSNHKAIESIRGRDRTEAMRLEVDYVMVFKKDALSLPLHELMRIGRAGYVYERHLEFIPEECMMEVKNAERNT